MPAIRKISIAAAACCYTTAIALTLLGPPSSAVAFQFRVRTNERQSKVQYENEALVPPSDRDAESWLKRAQDAAHRGDWKLAADTLERVIDKHGSRTVSLDGKRFYSAAHLARRQIVKWPEEGLAVFRLLYDPEARRLLHQARQSFNFEKLRKVARQFPMTTPGPEAMHLLAGWLIDRRQSSEAIELLDRLSRLPHSRVPSWKILKKQAIAYILADRRGSAARTLEQMRKLGESATASLPDDWDRQIDLIGQFLESAKFVGVSPAVGAISDSWPHKLGKSARHGRMTHVNPAISHDSDWSETLPGTERLNRQAVHQVIRSRARPPVWQGVSDGRRLFVTCPSGLVARDLATFDFLWQAFPKFKRRDPRIARHRGAVGMGFTNSAGSGKNRLDLLSTQTLFDEYLGEVSTAFGLVFAIEQDRTPGEQLPSRQGVLPTFNRIANDLLSLPNTLRAYEAETGRAVWTKGRGGPPADKLKFAHFYGTPVATGDHLVVPFVQRDDFYLAVLRPDGSIVKIVLLGTGRAGMFPSGGTLQPAVHDGTIYIATGAGLFIALNEYDFALRWLSTYERTRDLASLERPRDGVWRANNNAQPQADGWLSSPPIVVGGMVLLAPQDSEMLLAFDAQDGRPAWTSPRNRARYLVGSDEERVIIAGEKIVAVDLATGRPAWSTGKLPVSGRPAICGEHVLVPTLPGLVRLNLRTGEQVGEMVVTDSPLGNLLAFDGSLYSISFDRVAKFPDPEQSRALALARLEKNPRNVESIIRLAWLMMLSEDWPGALELLDRAEGELETQSQAATGPLTAELLDAHERLRSRVAHQRVRALLNAAGEMTSDTRREYLEQAVASARRPSDVVEAGLALCEYRTEESQPIEAFEHAFSMLQEVGSEPVRLDSRLKARAAVLIGERIRYLWEDLPQSESRAVIDTLNGIVAEAQANDRRDLLVRLADHLNSPLYGARLDLDLGKRALAAGDHETGIFHLLRAADRASGEEPELETLLHLAVAYCFPGDGLPSAPSETAYILKRLSRDFSHADLPPESPRAGEFAPTGTVASFVEEMKRHLPERLVNPEPRLPDILLGRSKLRLVTEDFVPRGQTNDGALFWDPSAPHDIHDQVVPMSVSGEVRGLRADATSANPLFWASDLNRMRTGGQPDSPSRGFFPRPAAVAGRIGVLYTPWQVCAIGLTSGRAMWAPLDIDYSLGSPPDPAIVHIKGMVVFAADSSTLVGIPARDNARPMWRRRWPARRLRSLHRVQDRLVAVDRAASKAFVIDPATGRIKREYRLFSQANEVDDDRPDPATDEQRGRVAVVGSVIWRSERKSVAGRDATTGRELWNIEVDGLVRRLFELDDDHLGISHGRDRFSVVRASTGEVVKELRTDGLKMPPKDAVLDFNTPPGQLAQGFLLLYTATDDTPSEFALQSYPLSAKRRPWRRELGGYATISRQMLRASPDYVAVVRNTLTERKDGQRYSDPARRLDRTKPPSLEIVHKRTGRRIGPVPYKFDEGLLGDQGAHRSRIITDVIVLNERIIAVAPEGYFVLAADPAESRSAKVLRRK